MIVRKGLGTGIPGSANAFVNFFSQYLLIFLVVVVCCCCSEMLNLVGLWSPPGSAFGSVIWKKSQNISFGKVKISTCEVWRSYIKLLHY